MKQNRKTKTRSKLRQREPLYIDRCMMYHGTLITCQQTWNGSKKKESSWGTVTSRATPVRKVSAVISAPDREISHNKRMHRVGIMHFPKPNVSTLHPRVNGFFFSSIFESLSKAIVYIISQAQ